MGTDAPRLTGRPTRFQYEVDDACLECAMWRERCGSLESDVADAKATIAALTEALADTVYNFTLVSWVADYRCRHNPDLLDTLAEAARGTIRRRAA